MKLELILTIVGSAVFVAIMFAWKQVMTAGVTEYGFLFFVPVMAGIFALAYWMDRKPKQPTE